MKNIILGIAGVIIIGGIGWYLIAQNANVSQTPPTDQGTKTAANTNSATDNSVPVSTSTASAA